GPPGERRDRPADQRAGGGTLADRDPEGAGAAPGWRPPGPLRDGLDRPHGTAARDVGHAVAGPRRERAGRRRLGDRPRRDAPQAGRGGARAARRDHRLILRGDRGGRRRRRRLELEPGRAAAVRLPRGRGDREAAVGRARGGEDAAQETFRLTHREGRVVEAAIVVSPVHDAGERVVGLSLVGRPAAPEGGGPRWRVLAEATRSWSQGEAPERVLATVVRGARRAIDA